MLMPGVEQTGSNPEGRILTQPFAHPVQRSIHVTIEVRFGGKSVKPKRPCRGYLSQGHTQLNDFRNLVVSPGFVSSQLVVTFAVTVLQTHLGFANENDLRDKLIVILPALAKLAK